jgi:hypothetical protein
MPIAIHTRWLTITVAVAGAQMHPNAPQPDLGRRFESGLSCPHDRGLRKKQSR